MLFSVSGVEINPLIPPAVAFAVSFFTSMAGVSGGFLLLPFQVSALGYVAPSVSATNQFFNIVATPGGIYRYLREGRMVWALAGIILLATFPGVLAGAVIRVAWLFDALRFKFFVALVLGYIGLRLLFNLLGKGGASGRSGNTAEADFRSAVKKAGPPERSGGTPGQCPRLRVANAGANLRRLSYDFGGRTFSVSVPGLAGLSFFVGVIGGVYGVGGGALLTPILVAVYGLPIYTVAASSLLATFGTSVFGVLIFMALAPFFPEQSVRPDFLLGLLFGLGGLGGTYLGARFQKHLPAAAIKWGLAVIIFSIAFKYLADFI